MDSGIYLRCCDCFDGMRDIADESIDMILTDPPYGVLNRGNPNAMWDVAVPFSSLWEQWERVIKPNGAIVVFGSGLFTAKMMMSNPRLWKYNLIWDKRRVTGFLNANRMPLRRHEDILVFYKSLPTYNPQMTKVPPHRKNHTRGGNSNVVNRCYGSFRNMPAVISDEKYPISIIAISKEHTKGKFFHPTQKPVELMQWLIRTYTNEGDLVLDCFMGSGTVGVACKKEHRRFIGMEIERQFYDIAVMRCSNEVEQLKLEF